MSRSSNNRSSKKGVSLSLTQFTGDKDAGSVSHQKESLDWAMDTLRDEIRARSEATDREQQKKRWDLKAGSHMKVDFRSAQAQQLSTVVPADMVAPFVALVGNLAHAITEEKLEAEFANFFPVLSTCVVKTGASTFGFVEVENRADLQALVLQAGRVIMGRQLRSDVATKEQIERLHKQKGRSTTAGGRFAAEGFTRDSLGQEQQPLPEESPSLQQVTAPRELSRSSFGAVTPPPKPVGAPADFGDFRLTARNQQPKPEPIAERTSWRKEQLPTASAVVPPTAGGSSFLNRNAQQEVENEEKKAVETTKKKATPSAKTSSMTATTSKPRQHQQSAATSSASNKPSAGNMFAALASKKQTTATTTKTAASSSSSKPAAAAAAKKPSGAAHQKKQPTIFAPKKASIAQSSSSEEDEDDEEEEEDDCEHPTSIVASPAKKRGFAPVNWADMEDDEDFAFTTPPLLDQRHSTQPAFKWTATEKEELETAEPEDEKPVSEEDELEEEQHSEPTSFQGLEVKSDTEMQLLAKTRWADIGSSEETVAVVVVVEEDAAPPTPTVAPLPADTDELAPALFAESVPEARRTPLSVEEQETNASPSTPTNQQPMIAAANALAPLAPGEEDEDGAQAFEQQPPLPAFLTHKDQQAKTSSSASCASPSTQANMVRTGPGFRFTTQQAVTQYPRYLAKPQPKLQQTPPAQTTSPPQYMNYSSSSSQVRSTPDIPLPRSYRQQNQQQLQPHQRRDLEPYSFLGAAPPPPPQQERQSPSQQQQQQPHGTRSSSSSSSSWPSFSLANHELWGCLPFHKFGDLALNGDMPTARNLSLRPQQHPKLFLGHVWARVPTGVIQWIMDKFGPRHFSGEGSTAFEPQLHFGPGGNFRGCLHCSVATPVHVQALSSALHKRILFDMEGVWFAETADQMAILDDHCRQLRALEREERWAKLKTLPSNALTCEIAHQNA